MAIEVTGTLPPGITEVVRRHGQVVAAGDQRATLADFRPDRVGQLVASAALPPDLVSSEVQRLVAEPDGSVNAFIRYTAEDGGQTVLRSRWVELPQGWRVHHVRNVPETPPRLPSEGPDDSGLDAPHWAGLRAGELRIQQCADCAGWIWSPRPLCPTCYGTDLRWPAVAPVGTVYSWTRTWQPFAPELTGHLPYLVVLVELPEAGRRRVLGVLHDSDGATVTVGARVHGEFDQPAGDEGWPLLRWRLT